MAPIEKYINPFTDFGFKKLFDVAEVAKFSPGERGLYEDSLKVYRDLKNVIDTAFGDGKLEGKLEEKKENILKALKRGKLSHDEIAEDFDVTVDFVSQIKDSMG